MKPSQKFWIAFHFPHETTAILLADKIYSQGWANMMKDDLQRRNGKFVYEIGVCPFPGKRGIMALQMPLKEA